MGFIIQRVKHSGVHMVLGREMLYFLEEGTCKIITTVNTFTVTYKFISKIPEDYNYT